MKKTAVMVTLIMLISGTVYSAEYSGVTASPYLNLGIGARACGMGEAYTAIVDDIDSVVWNPAGLVNVEDPQFTFMHNQAFEGTSYEYLAFGFPAEQLGLDIWGSIGISATLVRVEDIPQTQEILVGGTWQYDPEFAEEGYTYGAGGTVIGLAYSWQAAKMFSVGTTLKMINQKIAVEESWIPAMDFGILINTPFQGFDVGAVFQNISFMQMNQISEEEAGGNVPDAPLPFNLKFGLGYQGKGLFTSKEDPKDHFAAAIDGTMPINPANMPFKIHFGFEYGGKVAGINLNSRLGYRFNGNHSLISDLGALAGLSTGAGIGVNVEGMEADLDYAWIPYGDLGNTHRVGLTIKVGEPEPEAKPTVVRPPRLVKLTPKERKIIVTWSTEGLKDKSVAGYNVYMSYKPGGKYHKLTKKPIRKYYLTVGPLRSGLRTYFVVRSVSPDGKESGNSREISAVPR